MHSHASDVLQDLAQIIAKPEPRLLDPILQDAVPARQTPYCCCVYTEDTCSSKPSHELDSLKHQHQHPLASCMRPSYVFTDVSVEVGPGRMTQVVTDVEGVWHFAKKKLSGTWVSTGMFNHVWKKILFSVEKIFLPVAPPRRGGLRCSAMRSHASGFFFVCPGPGGLGPDLGPVSVYTCMGRSRGVLL